jgi:hypothetical protein
MLSGPFMQTGVGGGHQATVSHFVRLSAKKFYRIGPEKNASITEGIWEKKEKLTKTQILCDCVCDFNLNMVGITKEDHYRWSHNISLSQKNSHWKQFCHKKSFFVNKHRASCFLYGLYFLSLVVKRLVCRKVRLHPT